MTKNRLISFASTGIIIAGLSTAWVLWPSVNRAGEQTLWKEYPESHYPGRSRTVRMKDYRSPEACRYALQEELMSKYNVGNNIRYYCM